jgi:hypothetical protein
VLIVTVHRVPAARVAVAAVNVTVAVAVFELAFAAVNVVEPQPLVVGVARVARVKVGNTMAMVSAAASPVFKENEKEIDDAEDAKLFETVSTALDTVGSVTAVDVAMVKAVMSATAASVTATVRVARFAA